MESIVLGILSYQRNPWSLSAAPTSSISLPASTPTAITFGTFNDPGNGWYSNTYTAPETGWYNIDVSFALSGLSTPQSMSLNTLINGTVSAPSCTSAAILDMISINGTVKVLAGQVISFQMICGATACSIVGDPTLSFASIVFVRPG